jgi:cystathionine beta-lyase/cystathionine gamma-synthase
MPLSRSELLKLSAASRGVHAGQHVDIGAARPTVQPIHLATAYSYPTTDELDAVFDNNSLGYVYSRMANPTVRALEEAIAVVEGVEAGVAYASGMAAILGVLQTLVPSGGTILAAVDIYGATHALLHSQLAQSGYRIFHASTDELAGFAAEVDRLKPDVVYVESISNPLIKVADVRTLADIAHQHSALLVVDNTFASPIVLRTIPLGADVVIYSSTKHLAGHGDSTGGLVATSAGIADRLLGHRKFSGAILSPFDAWLTLRGMRTLELRVTRQSQNARETASWLSGRNGIARVHYPGLDGEVPLPEGFDPKLVGSMLSFEIAGASRSEAFAFQDALRLIEPATTLGDVQTLVLHPATTSHRPLTDKQRADAGIGEGLIRLSAGIEDVQDIISDIDQALSMIGR